MKEKVETPWGEIGYITFKRTYARRLNEADIDSPTEEFPDAVRRVVDACREQLDVGFTKKEEGELLEDCGNRNNLINDIINQEKLKEHKD